MTGSPVGQLGLGHLVVEVAALAGALADAGEHREAAVLLGDVVDELEDEDGLADAGAAEEADLAAAAVGGEQVDDLDAGLEHLDLAPTGRRTWAPGGGWAGTSSASTGPRSSTGSPTTLRMRPSTSLADRHHDGRAGVLDRHAAHQTVGGVHGDAADGVLAQVLRDLDDQVVGLVVDGRVGDRERGVDLGQVGRRRTRRRRPGR